MSRAPQEGMIMADTQAHGFAKRGFYLHASWNYAHPFAVRTWEPDDYRGMFALLRALGLNRVMIWPMTEIAPPPLSDEDRARFIAFRDIVRDAHDHGLECWLVFCPCVSTTEAIRSAPFAERAFYPHMKTFRLDDLAQATAYTAHLQDLLGCLNNADGYVFIDGDPGGYAGARPSDYFTLMHAVREVLGPGPSVIPWVWSGWGADWETEGPWKPDLHRLAGDFLEALKADPPGEPWQLLPGRSNREGQANGRINFELVAGAGLLDRSTLLTYEIIEYEPTPPAFILQLDDIRRVIRQELPLVPEVRGIMGNAQQPVTALHNLFYFAQCTCDPAWLDWTNEEVLNAFAKFLGGNPEVLVPALSSAHTGDISPDLPDRVRASALRSEEARCIPGGPERYLEILAAFTETRATVLRHTAEQPDSSSAAAEHLSAAAIALVRWWSMNRYVFSGEQGPGFRWGHTHPVLVQPLLTWVAAAKPLLDEAALGEAAKRLANTGLLEYEEAEVALAGLAG
jgi:hypothetical protein